MLDKLAALVSTILALSLAVERVIEILKGWIHIWPFAPEEDGSKELRRCGAIHVLSAVIGGVIAGFGHIAIIGSWNVSSPWDNAANVILAGLLASGGSAFWNHVLDIVKASKVGKEVQARLAVANNKAVTHDRTAYIA